MDLVSRKFVYSDIENVKFRPLVSIFGNFIFCIVVEHTSEEKSVNFCNFLSKNLVRHWKKELV